MAKKLTLNFPAPKHPRSLRAAGAGLLMLAVLLKPYLLFWIVPSFLAGRYCKWTVLIPSAAVFALIFLAGTVLLIVSGAGARDPHFDWRALATLGYWRKHWRIFLLPVGAALIFCSGICWAASIAAVICIVIAAAGAPGTEKLKAAALLPLLLCIALLAAQHLAASILESAVETRFSLLAKAVGRPLGVDAFLQRESEGFPVDRAPLRDLIAARPDHDGKLDYSPFDAPAAAAEKVRSYRQQHPDFLAALETYLALPDRGIDHRLPPGALLFGADTGSAASAHSAGARYLALQMQSTPGNRELVCSCDWKIRKLRDRMLLSQFLVSRLAAGTIERIRLNALLGTVSAARWSREEFLELLGDEPDWEAAFVLSIGDDAASESEFIGSMFGWDGLKELRRCAPDVVRLLVLHSQVVMLSGHQRALSALDDARFDGGPERARTESMAGDDGFPLCTFFSVMFSGNDPIMWQAFVRMMDRRTLAIAAFEILEMRNASGKLPENLDFLPKMPRDRWLGEPVVYEAGELVDPRSDTMFHGFCLSSRDRNGATIAVAVP